MKRSDLDMLTVEDLLARLIWGEARGEDRKGKVAVAWVVINRANHASWWGRDIKSVILKPYQFSCLNPNDPNLEKILALDYNDPSVIFLDCIEAARAALSGTEPDPTGGADSYHTTSMNPYPKWAAKEQKTVVIGHHQFYRTRLK